MVPVTELLDGHEISTAERRIGQLLLDEGLIQPDELQRALEEQRHTGSRLGFTLVSKGMISEDALTRALSAQCGIPAIDLGQVTIDTKVLALVPADFASKHLVLPLKRSGRKLSVAMADPTNLRVIDDLKFITRFDVEPLLAGEYSLRGAIERHYEVASAKLGELLEELEEQEIEVVSEAKDEDMSAAALRALVEDEPVVRLINGLLTEAVRRGASDIHVEPYERELRVRYRLDGVLQEIMKPPHRMQNALMSRLKILADLNIAERRVPQDGRIKMKIGKRLIDFRVSTLPTLFGEKIVLRILDRGALRLELEEFGMEPRAEKEFLEAISSPYGIILVTGPTGSGKTTSLYAALSRINNEEVNIMTAEDPVEYNLLGINQVQVRPKIGLTFASALRAFLRQDPNIIMVGEIRDTETGGIAVKASLTGHLVLSTLHTNDAASTITRLIDMGIETFNVASAVTLITAQRLVRRICNKCKAEATYEPGALESAGLRPEELDGLTLYRGDGCDACSGSGYAGRQGLYEVMPMSPSLRRLMLRGAAAEELKLEAIREGMLTLRQDGLIKMKRGVTTLEEVLKETAA